MKNDQQEEQRTVLALREVSRDNWRTALGMAVRPDQQRFISECVPIAAIALAKAYIRPGGLLWLPYAFYANTQMVGFTELAYEPDSQSNYWMFHFFIDVHYQGQGYGQQALQLLVNFVKEQHPQCHSINLTVHPENVQALRLYSRAGFQPTGDEREGEPIYQLAVRA